MRRRAPIIMAVTTAGLLALGGAAYAGGTGQPTPDPSFDDRCATQQVDNLIALGGVCPDTNVDPNTLLDLDGLVRLN